MRRWRWCAGEGCRVWDADGKEYLDFFASTVVTALGHCHPSVTHAIVEQANKILHVSNLHHSEPQAVLAELLCTHSFADRVFFCNSGAEANEAAIKLARKYGAEHGDGRFEIITALGSFHGRTLATITATGQEKVRRGFQPLPEGFRYVAVQRRRRARGGDHAAHHRRDARADAGRGRHRRAARRTYLRRVRELCDRHGLLLIFDEVQTGMGRTGTLFAYEQSGIAPDIMTLAKGLGSGVPIGAMLATEAVAASFTVGLARLDLRRQRAHLRGRRGGHARAARAKACSPTVRRRGEYLRERLRRIASSCPRIRDVRGHGLLVGVELDGPGGADRRRLPRAPAC